MNKAELIIHLVNVPDDEPLFLLRGSDRLAPQLVQSWCSAAKRNGAGEGRIAEATATAAAMLKVPNRKYPR